MPPSTPTSFLLTALLDSLTTASEDDPGSEPHVRAYIAWMTRDDTATRIAEVLRAEARALTGGARTYRHVAVLGYVYDAWPDHDGAGVTALIDGVEWLAGRTWFASGRVPSFEADPFALFGVALGVRWLGSSGRPEHAKTAARLRTWFREVLEQSRAIMTDPHELGLVSAARLVLSPSHGLVESLCHDAPVLAAALASHGEITIASSAEERAISRCLELPSRPLESDRAVTQLVALRWLYRTLPTVIPGRATVGDVVALLKGVSRSLRRWRWEHSQSTKNAALVRWEINNEYHVQDLLWVVLAPIFTDLEDEENLPSLGQKHPRYDLGIPSLKLIIEVKFVRQGTTRAFSKVIEEVAADASLYLGQRDRYNAIVAVVWDDTRHTEQHAELEQGLLGIPGVIGAVILSRPGRMDRDMAGVSANRSGPEGGLA